MLADPALALDDSHKSVVPSTTKYTIFFDSIEYTKAKESDFTSHGTRSHPIWAPS
jgi:hypothetical protein